MKIFTEYFGEIEISEEDIVTFEKGLLGLEDLKRFSLITNEELFIEWLQCIDEDFSIAVMNPFFAKEDYSFEIPESTIKELELNSHEDVAIRTVVVIPEDITKIRTNLQSPIIINMKNKKGKQIVLEGDHPLRYEFYEKGGD